MPKWRTFRVNVQGHKGEGIHAIGLPNVWARDAKMALKAALAYARNELGLEEPLSAEIQHD